MIDADCRQPFERCFCCLPASTEESKATSLDDDGRCYLCPVRIGGFIMLCGKRSLPFPLHCIIGADWPMVLLVYALILTINIVVLKVIAELGSPLIPIGAFGFCFLLCAYTCVACSDPGIVYRKKLEASVVEMSSIRVEGDEDRARLIGGSESTSSSSQSTDVDVIEVDAIEASKDRGDDSEQASPTAPSDSKMVECGICNMQRPPSARHCYYCGTCVDELDHHCPWSGKCIGKRNMHFFSAFLTSLCCQTYFLIGAFIYFCYFALSDDNSGHLRGDTGSNHTAVYTPQEIQ